MEKVLALISAPDDDKQLPAIGQTGIATYYRGAAVPRSTAS
jgi:hypothetical protein